MAMARPLSFGPSDARAIAEYNRAVFERFVRKVRRLPGTQATRRLGIGHESLFDTLVHILNVQEVWFAYIMRGRNSDREIGALFEDASRHPHDWAGFDAYSERVWTAVDEYVRRVTDRELGRRVSVFWMPGRYTVRDAVLQATLEEGHHIGEIIGALWQDDRKPPDMTWIDVRRPARRTKKRAAR
jgi:uncharacterized damage-inducible protein DinB